MIGGSVINGSTPSSFHCVGPRGERKEISSKGQYFTVSCTLIGTPCTCNNCLIRRFLSWYAVPRAPLRDKGETSERYIGQRPPFSPELIPATTINAEYNQIIFGENNSANQSLNIYLKDSIYVHSMLSFNFILDSSYILQTSFTSCYCRNTTYKTRLA